MILESSVRTQNGGNNKKDKPFGKMKKTPKNGDNADSCTQDILSPTEDNEEIDHFIKTKIGSLSLDDESIIRLTPRLESAKLHNDPSAVAATVTTFSVQ